MLLLFTINVSYNWQYLVRAGFTEHGVSTDVFCRRHWVTQRDAAATERRPLGQRLLLLVSLVVVPVGNRENNGWMVSLVVVPVGNRVNNGWMDGWMDGWVDGWMDEWMDGWYRL